MTPQERIVFLTNQLNHYSHLYYQEATSLISDEEFDFLLKECSQVSHLLICLNKVDLCPINLTEEAKKLAYDPHYQYLNWQEKDSYVYHRYFTPVQSQIQRLNQHREKAARFFITSIYQRDLLELPLIYISSYVNFS